MSEEREILDYFGRQIEVGDLVQYNTGARGDNGFHFYTVDDFKITPNQVRVCIGDFRWVAPHSLLIISKDMREVVMKRLVKSKLKSLS